MRVFWHNVNDREVLLAGIEAEVDYLEQNRARYAGMLRINQAQLTVSSMQPSPVGAIFGWSLIDQANDSNPYLLDRGDWQRWLSVMPIAMFDYANCANGDFNNRIVAEIQDYNRQYRGRP